MKMNEARRLNNKAVIEEKERLNDPTYEKRKLHQEYKIESNDKLEHLKKKGLSKDKKYLLETALKADSKTSKKKKINVFGWDVFNDDSLYRAYHKRTANLENINKQIAQEEKDSDRPKIEVQQSDKTKKQIHDSEARKEAMAAELFQRDEKRKQFSRRRAHNKDADVDYINDRNEVFNKKLERNFGK